MVSATVEIARAVKAASATLGLADHSPRSIPTAQLQQRCYPPSSLPAASQRRFLRHPPQSGRLGSALLVRAADRQATDLQKQDPPPELAPEDISTRPLAASKQPLSLPPNRPSPRGVQALLPNARPGWLLVPFDVVSQKVRSRLRFPTAQSAVDPKGTVGKTFIVTGGSSGVAKEFAREVALAGGKVVLAVRDYDAGLRTVDEIKDTAAQRGQDPNGLQVEAMHLDLGSFESVRKFAAEWEARGEPLHVLASIAGETYWGGRVSDTPDGFETHLQVNFLSQALLNLLMLPSLLRGAPSRIVNVASSVHELATLDLPGIANGRGPNWSLWGNPLGAYCHSKLAIAMFTNTLQRKLPENVGVDAMSIHPGIIGSRAIRGVWKWFEFIVRDVFTKFMILEPTEGARGVLSIATRADSVLHARAIRDRNSPDGPYFGSLGQPMHIARQGQDLELDEQLWTLCLQLLDVPLDTVETLCKEEEIASKEPSLLGDKR